MPMAARLKQFLEHYQATYKVLIHEKAETLHQAVDALNIPKHQVIQSTVVTDGLTQILLVAPYMNEIDYEAVRKIIRDQGMEIKFKILEASKMNALFFDCHALKYPPFGEPYDLFTIIDRDLDHLETIYFADGSLTSMIQMRMTEFHFLSAGTKRMVISQPRKEGSKLKEGRQSMIKAVSAFPCNLLLPELPLVAKRILSLATEQRNHPPDPEALLNLISKDTVLSAQMLCFARVQNENAKKENAESRKAASDDALIALLDPAPSIKRFMNFSTVSHLALGFAAGHALSASLNMKEIQSFWQHTLFCAKLVELLSKEIPEHYKMDPGSNYTLALFHNFGWILFAYLFPPEFRLLNKWKEQNPTFPIEILEKRLLGMGQAMQIVSLGHAQLGAWLMHHWGMPESIIMVSRAHHALHYEGPYQKEILLIQLANQLLKKMGVGDGESAELSGTVLKFLGLTEIKVEAVLTCFRASVESLNQLAAVLAS